MAEKKEFCEKDYLENLKAKREYPVKKIANDLLNKHSRLTGDEKELRQWNIEAQAFFALFGPGIMEEEK